MSLVRRIAAARSSRDERGTVIVLTALAITAICIVAALVLDIGNASQERRQAQNAADASALAGAQDMSSGDTLATAVVAVIKASVASNFGTVTWTGCSDSGALAIKPDVLNLDSCISWDAVPPVTTLVRVVIPTRQIATGFAAVGGLNNIPVTAAAVAKVTHSSGGLPCAFCAIGPTSSIQNGNISVTGGNVYFGGDVSCNPQAHITAVGGANEVAGNNGCGGNHFTPAATSVSALGDPLGPSSGFAAAPSYSSLTDEGSCNGGNISPGIYQNISGCNLSPGLYVVTGSVGSATGTGVTLFMTCGTSSSTHACASGGEAGGNVSINGFTTTSLVSCPPTGPCSNGAMAGLLLWFDRNDTGSNGTVLSTGGTATMTLVGTVYAASGNVSLNGTPTGVAGVCVNGGVAEAFCSAFVVNSITFSGQGNFSALYLSSQNIVLPAGQVSLNA